MSFPNPFSVLVPGFPFGVLAWIALVPLLLCLEEKSPLESFRLGWVTGFIAFTGMLYWVIVAMHRYGGIPIPVSAIILIALTLYLSLFVASFATLLTLVRQKTGWSPLIVAPPIWVTLEYLRSVLLTGFPWENLGYSQYLALYLIQIADVTGVYGISFLVVLVNGLIVTGILQSKKTGRVPLRIPLIIVLLLGVIIAYGSLRINQESRRVLTQKPTRVAIAQGNVDQGVKWEPAYQRETIEIYKTLTREVAGSDPDLVIWPETAVPFFFPFDQPLSPVVRVIPSETGAYLLFGSPFYQEVENRVRYLNSAYLLSPRGEIIARYDKIHLVPFGEYVPLSRFLPFIRPLVEGVGDFVSGSETQGTVVFTTPRGKFGVLICYEIIFPNLNRQFVRKGADFLVTITNDAWFGRTSAPFQHFSMATFRAVENRTFVARAANTGVSGIIDSTGRIIQQSKIFSRQALTGEVFMGGAKTIYTRYGDLFAYFCLGWSGLLIGWAYGLARRTRSSTRSRRN
ncbi:MAG: apolipoprotein N-acyltransferase [Proteobacteria bacterium]|nr:apolipoprotein N-acyltransferase [Pseudomonadota bacterium]